MKPEIRTHRTINYQEYFHGAVKAVFQSRPNRFIVECAVQGKPIRAYLPNPGRLWELLFPGSIVYLVKRGELSRGSTDYTVVAVERDARPIMLHTHVNNLVARRLIEQGRIPGLEGSEIVRPEVTIGNSRFDFLLKQKDREIIVEIKSCTLVGDRIAMFPDAITARGTKHLRELEAIAREGRKAFVVFLVHWSHAQFFMPEHHTDLEFTRTLLSVKDSVTVRAVSVEWLRGLTLGRTRDLVIPWDLIDREAHDSGSYILILRMKRDRKMSIGGLGEVRFRKGYYLYIGSARNNLSQRIERHRRLNKRYHWHIDHLRASADFHSALPIRASEDLECEIAEAMKGIADWEIQAFGSSDCACRTHLFGMTEDPVHSRSFINLLQYFRIDRLEKYLPGKDNYLKEKHYQE
jgi:sugar fermentation stimulation protein A